MKRIHIMGAGGPAGVGLTRCLKRHYSVTGQDSSLWGEKMMECDLATFEVIPDMNIAIPDALTSQSDFRPPLEQIELCQDKAKLAELLGDLAPKIYWIRDTHGAGGAGAQMASEYLPGSNYSVEFVFHNGEKVADFQKQRLSYSVKEKTKGIDNRGSSAVSVCTNKPNVFKRAEEALNMMATATDTLLHGFYGVDLKCDSEGVPKVTEINAGRLLTASYSFYHLTGYNLSLVGVRAYLGEEQPILPEYPLGMGIIRQVGQEPRLFGPEITKEWV